MKKTGGSRDLVSSLDATAEEVAEAVKQTNPEGGLQSSPHLEMRQVAWLYCPTGNWKKKFKDSGLIQTSASGGMVVVKQWHVRENMAEYGYGGEILKVDLSAGKTSRTESREYTDRFIGGRGLAARIFWEMVPPEAGALEPENCLVCASGPVAGFFGFAGCRWEMLGKTRCIT